MTFPLQMVTGTHTCKLCGSVVDKGLLQIHRSVCPGRAAALAVIPATN
jgi:hypothetical protein